MELLLTGLFDLWARFFDFYMDNGNMAPIPDSFWMGSAWDIMQGIGALFTAGALIAIIFQTISMKKQTDTFEKQLGQNIEQTKLTKSETDFSLRPWLYPVDTTKHLQLFIGVSDDSSKSILDIRVEKKFENAGVFPTKKIHVYVKGGDKRVEEFKSGAYTSDLTAVFPKQTFYVDSPLSVKDLHVVDSENVMGEDFKFTRYKLDKHLYISILLDYEYRSGETKKLGYYKGLFRIDKLQHYGR
jgi:hypothetical protein